MSVFCSPARHGDVGVGVFPEVEEILVGGLGFGGVAGEGVGAGGTEMRKRAQREFSTMPRWSRNFWNSAAARGAIVGGQIGLASNVGGIQRLQTAITLAGSSIEMFAEIIQALFVAIE